MVCIHREDQRSCYMQFCICRNVKKIETRVLGSQVKTKLILLHNNVNVLNAT